MKAYYVSPTGNDSYAGTLDWPFKTIQKAIAQTAGESKTIYLRGGSYDLREEAEQSKQTVAGLYIEGNWHVGSTSASLTIQPYQDESPVLEGSRLAPGSVGIFLKDVQNVDIKGLEIYSAKSHGIEVVNAKNVNILDNVVHSNQGSGIGVRGYLSDTEGNGGTAQRSEHIRIERNEVRHNVLDNSGAQKGQQNWGGAVYIRHTAHASIANNQVYENYGEGIIAVQSHEVAIDNNTVHDNYSVNVYLDNASNATVKNNFIYTAGNETFFRDKGEAVRPAIGISLANEVYDNVEDPSLYYLNNIAVSNNILVGGLTGLYYGTYGGKHSHVSTSQKGLKNAYITNNTIYNPQLSFVGLDSDPEIENVEFSNNIFSKTDGTVHPAEIESKQGLRFSHNLWDVRDRAIEDSILSPNDVIAAPMLANPGGLNPQDYQLQPGSPAIDAGKVVVGITDSAVGRPDIGAVEFGTNRLISSEISVAAIASNQFLGLMLLFASAALLKKMM